VKPNPLSSSTVLVRAVALCLFAAAFAARGEAILQLFNVNWADMAKKMPEIAEAGYDAIWIPPPAKGSSVYSIGYDIFDPFDLGDLNQSGTVATHWGTKAQLQELVRTAHRFGLRVYLDNVMNHRAFTVPGYDANTPTNFYPGLQPKDFHLQTVGNYFRNWPSVQDWNNQWDVQYQSLGGLIDLATEPGSVNGNFGATSGSTTTKPNFIRHPGQNQFYMDTTKPAIEGSLWHPFNGTNGTIVSEDVNSYLIRSVLYTMDQTKCDGFRLDAVKHVPSGFFGDSTATFNGYCGAIQAMFDYIHGYGTNATGNGYIEPDDSRNSCFNSEAVRNDALLFGEHLGQPPTYSEYISTGMRLLNSPLRDQMNSALQGSASLSGYDQPGAGTIDPRQSVMFAQSHDASGSFAAHRELQNAFYFMHEGTAVIYSDGYNQSGAPNYFPSIAYANYLGEYSDNYMPDVCYVHNQLARGYTNPRWSDQNVVAFERFDYREGGAAQDQVCVLFVMNDNYSYPGDATFDDGVGQIYDGYYGGIAISNSKNVGLAVGFPPGSVLVQLASSSPTSGRAYQKLLVHSATASLSAAQASINAPNPQDRLVYVGGQSIPSGGGAIELNVPSGAWVCYGYQWPEASRANVSTNAIVFKQGGNEVQHITITRTDGVNGDTNGFNPLYPFKMRGSVDAYGNVIGGVHVSNLTYAIDVPVVTNANFDIISRCDASCVNTLIKMDGGIDLNSQMGLGPTNFNGTAPTNFLDLRDNKPGYADDVFLGYEQTAFQFRNGPEKFAARVVASNNCVSLGAETYFYTVGGTSNVVAGSGYGASITNQTVAWVQHDPTATNTATAPNNSATQRVPLAPAAGQSVDLYVKSGYQFQVNTCFIYYTTDGSNPEGAFGTGKGTTKVVQANWVNHDSAASNIDWWKGTIPSQANGTQVRYKIALFSGGSVYAGQSINSISDSESSGSKLYGLSQFAISNFNPTTATVWLHNDLNPNNTATGLQPGFHIVRARTFLPRSGKSSVFNTFSQTFYYDGALPTGAIVYPANSGSINNSYYTVVVRADSTVTGVDFQIQDSDPSNDDSVTGKPNGNGTNVFVAATAVTPDATITANNPNLPQEFRFVYTNIPTSGSAQIIVRLKEFATTVYPNRLTLITNVVNTLAPAQTVSIAVPATDGTVLPYGTNVTYLVQTCFSSTLPASKYNFQILINGVLQPQANYSIQPLGNNNTWCPGYATLLYNWHNPPLGTNTIQVAYTNLPTPLTDTRSIIVAPPLRISGLDNNNQLVVWASAPGVNYQIYATTNLAQPFTPISNPITGTGSSTVFYDPNPAPQKFYQVVQLP
jgi:glycosidase